MNLDLKVAEKILLSGYGLRLQPILTDQQPSKDRSFAISILTENKKSAFLSIPVRNTGKITCLGFCRI